MTKHWLGFVPSAIPGREYILCSFGKCASYGKAEINIVVQTKAGPPGKPWECEYNTYLFCSDKCRQAWFEESTSRV